jgi:predicted dehydrogenase
MTKDVIRMAVIGCGRVAQHYRKILSSNVVNGWRMVGVCDIEPAKADELAASLQCPAYGDYALMMEQTKPNLVVILTPSGLHYLHARHALEFGAHVLIEKPIAMLPAQARELQELGTARSLMVCVAFQNRLNPAIECLRQALAEKRFGKIVTATMRLRWCRYQQYYEDGWHGTWAQDGGVINQQAIHHVDALNWLLGPVDAVCATIANRLNRLEAEDTLVGIVRFASGALGTIEATSAARPQDFEASLSVVGEKGMALIGGIALNRVETWNFIEPQPGDAEAPQTCSRDVPNGYGLSHGPLLQAVIDALRQGSTTAPVSAEQGMRTTELIHALYRSDEIGGWVRLESNPVSERLGKFN